MASLEIQIAASGNDGFVYDPGNHYEPAFSCDYIGKSSGNVTSGWLRFLNVTIPAGSTITSVVIRHKADSNLSGTTCKCKIYGEDADNPNAPTSYANYWAKTRTSNYSSWTVGAWTAGSSYDSVDIAAVVQEIIDRPGWASGNAIQLFEQDDGSDNNAVRTGYSYDASATDCARLEITYTEPVTSKTSSDSGSGAESSSLIAAEAKTSADNGVGADSIDARTQEVADQGAGAEVALANAAVLTGDGGDGSEIGGLLQSFYSSDAGSGADGLKMISGKAGADVKLRSHQGQVGLPHKEVSI